VLLPALPKAWSTGQYTGLRARGGFEVSARWRGGQLQDAEIVSLLGKRCRIRYGKTVRELETERGQRYRLQGVELTIE
jgi:alpha-L-fucosidase 2